MRKNPRPLQCSVRKKEKEMELTTLILFCNVAAVAALVGIPVVIIAMIIEGV